MNTTEQGTDRLGLTLRILSDDELWGLFLDHTNQCLQEFWEEVQTRKATGTSSKNSLLWTMGEIAR
jgi:hypothetical protein